MALPVTITGINTTVACVGPFKVAAGNYSQVAIDARGALFGSLSLTGAGAAQAVAQTFTNGGSSSTITGAAFYLAKTGTPTGQVYAQITQTDASGTVLATSDQISETLVTAVGDYFTFNFASPPTISASATFGVVLRRVTPDAVNYVNASATSVAYAGGLSYSYNGTTWTSGSNDLSSVVFKQLTIASDAYYFFGRNGTTATTLSAYKATAPDTSWSSIATKTGFTTAILSIAGYKDGTVIHLLVCDGTAASSVATKYVSFDTTNDTFLATTETVAAAASNAGQQGTNPVGCSLVVRSTGEVVAFYNGVQTKTSGTFRARVYYRRRTAVNTWSAETEVDAVAARDSTGPIVVLGASDRVHFVYHDVTVGGVQRHLTSANVLGTVSSAFYTYTTPASDIVSLNDGGTIRHIGLHSAGTVFYWSSADNPTISTSSVSFGNAARGVDNNGIVSALYTNTTDSDLYIKSSSDFGATFGSATSAFVGTVSTSTEASLSKNQQAYQRGSNVVFPYVVNDNGTLKYNEYTISAVANIGTASGAGASNVVGAIIAQDTVTAAGVGGSSIVGTQIAGVAVTAAGVGGTTATGTGFVGVAVTAAGVGGSAVVGQAVLPNYVSGDATASGVGGSSVEGNRVQGRIATAVGTTIPSAFRIATPGGSPENYQNTTTVVVIPASQLSAATGRTVRLSVQIQAAGTGRAIPIYIAQQAASGDVYDFLNTPTRVLFSGTDYVTTASVATVVSDWVDLPELFDSSKNYCVAINYPTDIFISANIGPATGVNTYTKTGSGDATTINKSGYSLLRSDSANCVNKIEVRPDWVGAALTVTVASGIGAARGTSAITTYDKPLVLLGATNLQNRTTVHLIPASHFTSAAASSQVQLTVKFNANAGHLATFYMGQQATTGDPYDFLNSPVPVTFGGGQLTTTGVSPQTAVSDWITLSEPFDSTKNYLVAIDWPTGTLVLPQYTPSVGAILYGKSGTGDAVTVDKTGYSVLDTDNANVIGRIEVGSRWVGEAITAATPTFVIVSWAQVTVTDAAIVGGIVSATATAAGTGATTATGNSFAAGTGTATGAGATTVTGQAVAGRTVTAGGIGASNIVNRSFYATIALSSGIGAGGAASAYIFGVAVSAAGIGATSIVGGQLGVNIGSASGLGTATVVGASTAATNGAAAGIGASSVTGTGLKPASAVAAGLAAGTATGFSFAASGFLATGAGAASATGITILARAVTAAGTGASSVVGGQLGVNVFIGAGLGVAAAVGASTATTTAVGAGIGSATAPGTNIKPASATAAGLAAGTATGFGFAASTFLAAGTGAASATGIALLARTVTAAGVGVAAAAGGQLGVNVLIGSGLGVATATGASTAATTGTAAGLGATTAPGTNVKPATATATGLAAGTATGRSFVAGVVSAVGTSTATATGLAIFAGRATAAGTGVAAATGGQLGVNVAIAAGIGAATFVGRSTAASVAAASGIGAAPWTGTGLKPAGVTATGTSTAAATGRATVAGVATSVGTGASVVLSPARLSAINLVAPPPIFTAPAVFFVSPLRLGDRVLDYGLRTLDLEADKIFICNNFPTTYLEASSTYAIGSKTFGTGVVFGAPAAGTPKGRKVTSLAVSGGIATTVGTPQCWAVVDSVNSRLLATGPANGFTTVGVDWTWTLEQIPIHMDG